MITRTIENLAPNTFDPNNSNNQSSWFSCVRNVYSNGKISPPTKTEFLYAWNNIVNDNSDFAFHCNGDTFKELVNDLKANAFLENFLFEANNNDTKIFTWIKMIIAFNMYAEIRKHFRLRPYNRISFIGSIKDTVHFNDHIYYAYWKRYFNGRRVMFVEDGILLNMINFVKNGDIDLFWDEIFSMYNNCIISDKY